MVLSDDERLKRIPASGVRDPDLDWRQL